MHEVEIANECRSRIMKEDEDVFVLLKERMYRKRDYRHLVPIPLFPGYVFVETADITDFRIRLQQIRKMTKVLGVGEEVVPITDEEEQILRSLTDEDHIVRFSKGIKRGSRLVVTEGALMGLEGRVKWIDRHRRFAIVRMSLLGRRMNVKLGLEVVRVIPDEEPDTVSEHKV